MGALIVGFALIALGIVDYRRERVKEGAILVSGTVVRLVDTRSKLPGRSDVLQAPIVSYRHPESGETIELQPGSFSKRVPGVGATVQVAHSPSSGDARLVRRRPWSGLAAFATVGVAMIGFQVLSWIG